VQPQAAQVQPVRREVALALLIALVVHLVLGHVLAAQEIQIYVKDLRTIDYVL
jgi:hypothetical protein